MTSVHPPPVPGRELANPPTDGISNLRFSNHSDNLLVSSWDKSVRLYDASANILRGEFIHGGPVLDCCFHDDSSGFSASADNKVRRIMFSHGKEDVLGRHDAPVRCIEYSYAAGQVITGSWDKTLKCWDPRVGNRVVVATAGRHVNVYDLGNMSQPEQQRESSLYALSSVEGRVAMEFFDLSEASQAKNTIYNMCTQKEPHDYSEQLYYKYKETLDEYITSTMIESGYSSPKKKEKKWSDQERKKAQQNAKAMHMVFCAFGPEIYEGVSSCSSAKELWNKLEEIHGNKKEEPTKVVSLMAREEPEVCGSNGDDIQDGLAIHEKGMGNL
ncbi:Mitotic checkpoint protein BUB3.1 [Hibiscus syriacus]|uniref:Mitotic checkpoint protein BUB3.1 n=1 Tax=Hibiscus syriacus TaxID=106335 RepID=A0A6A3AQU6_HIBSY|nr:Mitotic checkpoint protein BUB3.1 [Hibiscus syriacus]